jgi:FkbM family methyltransferase
VYVKTGSPEAGSVRVATVKSLIQTGLARVGLYQRIKASFLYNLYWRVADPTLVADSQKELGFYRHVLQGLRPGDLVVDVGANEGFKTDTFLRLGAAVVAVEPDAKNQRILKERFIQLRLKAKPVTIVGAAVSDKVGTETMWVDQPGSAKNTLSQKWVDTLRHDVQRFGEALEFAQQTQVETTTLDQLIATYGRPFYIKIDVEGAEPKVLKGLGSSVPFVSFEVNLPEFRREGLECVELLQRLNAKGMFNYVADVRRGLVLDRWVSAMDIANTLTSCSEKSVEIFWRS